ncbi:MAG: TIGR02444 family protein [Actinomycetia bacterium]|nr:TIGR02444 family protein [Actinomycetes bacterium]MCH9709244.1 TIGR02444 family protein [Actinomycetes bacterium]MCH9766800.1 TIGR02444 family protein [Actinomycetes bacterium]
MTTREGRLQRFALNVYGAEGVPRAAVLLQDRCGVDVNVLLLAAFVGSAMGASFGRAEAECARDRTQQWQHEVVRPLRAVRTRLKDGPAPVPAPATTALRDQIKAAELNAEMIELGELSDFASCLDASPAPGDTAERATAAMLAVVRLAVARDPGADEREAIAIIASAVAQFEER